MLIVGLTGGIGSGKSAATTFFEQYGIEVVDADVVARKVVEPRKPALKEIEKHFGPDLISHDGNLDRAKLRDIIFSSPDEKEWLESLLHPSIREEIINQLALAKSPYTILVSPLLLETNQHKLVTRTLLIDTPEALQIERAANRDSSDPDKIKSIIASQLSRECKISLADDIILNDQNLDHLKQEVDRHHQLYMDLLNGKETTQS